MSDTNNIVPSAEPTNISDAASEVSNELPEQTEDGSSSEGVEASLEDSNVEDQIAAAEAAGEITKKEAQVLKKQLKIKVDGQEFDETIDFNDEEGLKKHLQKSKAFDKRLKEFSGYKSQVEQAFEMLKNDPEAFLEQFGLDVDGLAEKRLAKKIEEMKKSPEQIEAEKMRKELEEYKKKEKELQDRAQKAELERMKNEQAAQIENDISEALDDAKSILPKKNPAVMQRIAQTMLFAMQKGFVDVTAKDVIPLVEKQYREEVSQLLGSSSDEVLEMFASKERLNNYRKAKVASKKPSATQQSPVPQKPQIRDTGAKNVQKEVEQPKYRMNDLFGIRSK